MILKFSDEQLAWAAKRCMERCSAGNHWPPDLAEFTALAGELCLNPFGLSVADVMAEYWRYAKDCWKHDSAEKFPWAHPVLYQICPELRREGARRNLPHAELEAMAKRLLTKWIKHVEKGFSVPPVCRKLAAPEHPTGLTPAQQMLRGQRYVK
ncbi:replication protein P [Rahnella aceris]|uniref:replication protein P n=1 Tax=Rahnella sp. (strain Y9602) TaxID=2703885 RepID=UPI00281518A3|nr:replication protein P [Rahnella aceris]